MLTCRVCGKSITDELEREAGRTASGAVELDPARGTKRYWGGQWHYFDSLACRSKFESAPNTYAAE
jgi:YHS domain-containing protein